MNEYTLFDDNNITYETAPIKMSNNVSTLSINDNARIISNMENVSNGIEPNYLWVIYLICGIILLISFSLSIISATNKINFQIIVSVPPDFEDGFTMEKTLNSNTAEILGLTTVVETHTSSQITTQHEIVVNDFSIGSQTITSSDITNFSKNVFLNITLNTSVNIVIPIKTNTTLFLPLTGFSANKFNIEDQGSLFDFKSNNTAIAFGKLNPGSYCITMNMNLPFAISSSNTKLVPIIVSYDDAIQEWVPLNPGLLSSVDYIENQTGAKYIWNVTFGFMSTGCLAAFPVYPNATRVGFQVYVSYGIGQTTSISWDISTLQFSITQL